MLEADAISAVVSLRPNLLYGTALAPALLGCVRADGCTHLRTSATSVVKVAARSALGGTTLAEAEAVQEGLDELAGGRRPGLVCQDGAAAVRDQEGREAV